MKKQGWQTLTLRDLIGKEGLLVDGDWVESKDQDPNGDVRLIQLADVGDGVYLNRSARFLTSDKAKQLKCTYLKEGDILIARMPDPLGRACIFPQETTPCVTVVDVCILRPNKKLVDINWLTHTINSPDFRNALDKYIMGTTRARISRKNLEKITLELPPLPEQKRIAEVLDKADALRGKRRLALQKLDTLLQSVFLEMFGDPVKNPKGFERGTIRDLVSSVNYGTSEKAGQDGEFPILRMNNITFQGGWNFTDLKYIDLSEKDRKKYFVKKGDILFNRTNSKELVGKTAVYREDYEMAFAGYLIRVRTNPKNNPEYISAFLNSRYGKLILNNMCKNIIGMANINAQELQDISILKPQTELQNRFALIVEKVEKAKAKLKTNLEKTENLFQSLQQRAFKGELFNDEFSAVESQDEKVWQQTSLF